MPFSNCINKDTNEFLDVLKLEEKFKEILKDIKDTNIVFTCGSGVTASVLAFALSLIMINIHQKFMMDLGANMVNILHEII